MFGGLQCIPTTELGQAGVYAWAQLEAGIPLACCPATVLSRLPFPSPNAAVGGRPTGPARYDPDEVSSVEQPWASSTPSALAGPAQVGQGAGPRAQALQAMRNQDRSLMASR